MATTKRAGGRASASRSKLPEVPWRQPQLAPIVLISGPEKFFAAEAVSGLRSLSRHENPDVEITELDASAYAAGELTTLVSPSLFMEPRLVIVDRVEHSVDAFLEEAIAYLGQTIPDTVLVLRHGGGVRGKKLLDAVRKFDGAVEIACVTPKANELFDFASAEFRVRGRRAEPPAVQALVAAFNSDLAELAAACRQLIEVSEGEITTRLVDRYYGGRVETTGFKIADAAIAGRVSEALVLARSGFQTGLNPVPIVSALAMKLRTMARVSGLGGSDAQLAGRVGAAPWQVGQARRELRDWDDRSLGSAIMLTAETDAMVKGGSRDPEFAVERLVRRIAAREF